MGSLTGHARCRSLSPSEQGPLQRDETLGSWPRAWPPQAHPCQCLTSVKQRQTETECEAQQRDRQAARQAGRQTGSQAETKRQRDKETDTHTNTHARTRTHTHTHTTAIPEMVARCEAALRSASVVVTLRKCSESDRMHASIRDAVSLEMV